MRGFFPLTASGLLLLLLSLALSLQAARVDLLRSSLYLQEASLQELVLTGANARNDLRDLCRYATYQALQEVCLQASSYPTDGERVGAVENLARDLFFSLLPLLPSLYHETDGRLLLLPGEKPHFHLFPTENGFCLLKVEMPGAELVVSSHDGSSLLRFPLSELEVFVDSRFFLLQERMNLFLRNLKEVEREWRCAQYLSAWTQALSLRRIKLSPSFAEESLLTAWSVQELRSFGSFDYLSPFLSPPPLPPLEDRRETLRLLEDLRKGAETLCSELEEGARKWVEKPSHAQILEDLERVERRVEGLEEGYRRLQHLVEGSRDPLVSMLSGSTLDSTILLRLRWNLSGVKSFLLSLRERMGKGENSSTLASSLKEALLESSTEENRMSPGSLRLLLREAVKEFERLVYVPEGTLPAGEILSHPTPRREELTLHPPPPVEKYPGLSVLRGLEVREVRFQREDPSGLLGLPTATPVYLPFLGVRVWWAQWKTEVVLEGEPVEEILDYPYPTLLLPHLSSRTPLTYRFVIPKKKFETRVVVFSPWPFSVSS